LETSAWAGSHAELVEAHSCFDKLRSRGKLLKIRIAIADSTQIRPIARFPHAFLKERVKDETLTARTGGADLIKFVPS